MTPEPQFSFGLESICKNCNHSSEIHGLEIGIKAMLIRCRENGCKCEIQHEKKNWSWKRLKDQIRDYGTDFG